MKILRTIVLIALLVKLTACATSRGYQYMNGQFDTTRLSQYKIPEPIVLRGDLISIVVYSDNPQATALYNLPNVAGSTLSSGASSTTAGYLVDERGDIQFQSIGNLHVEGLTKLQLTELLNSKLTEYLKNPYYSIRFLNYKITMLGEVSREGVYTIPNEKVNILEALGLAGGLTIYARRENVLVVREYNGKREFARLDLTSPEVLKSPYYFLQQNDMVIVEQVKAKAANYDQTTTRTISIASTIISTLAIIYSVLRR